MSNVRRIAWVGLVLSIAVGAGQLVETLRGGDSTAFADGLAGIQQLNIPASDPTVAPKE